MLFSVVYILRVGGAIQQEVPVKFRASLAQVLDLVGRAAIAASANFGSGNYLEMERRNGDPGKIGKKNRKTLLNRRGTYDLLSLAGMLKHGVIGEVCEKMGLQRQTRLLIKSHTRTLTLNSPYLWNVRRQEGWQRSSLKGSVDGKSCWSRIGLKFFRKTHQQRRTMSVEQK